MKNVIKSFFLGLFVGVILQLHDYTNVLFQYKVLMVLASGSVGFIIGFITEWLTSLLPIRMANSKTYFLINNVIALVVTALLVGLVVVMTSQDMDFKGDLLPIMFIVLGIICIANLLDFMLYRRAQRKLEVYKKLLKNK